MRYTLSSMSLSWRFRGKRILFGICELLEKIKKIPPRVLIKYILLQIPSLLILLIVLYLLQKSFNISAAAILIIVLLWIIKDLIMFPFVWRSYDTNPHRTVHSMVGKKGIARERLDPSGYVLIGNELWNAEVAEGYTTIEEGNPVTVIDIAGLTLIVSPGADQ